MENYRIIMFLKVNIPQEVPPAIEPSSPSFGTPGLSTEMRRSRRVKVGKEVMCSRSLVIFLQEQNPSTEPLLPPVTAPFVLPAAALRLPPTTVFPLHPATAPPTPRSTGLPLHPAKLLFILPDTTLRIPPAAGRYTERSLATGPSTFFFSFHSTSCYSCHCISCCIFTSTPIYGRAEEKDTGRSSVGKLYSQYFCRTQPFSLKTLLKLQTNEESR